MTRRNEASAVAPILAAAAEILAGLGADRSLSIEAIGWATVELERAEAELTRALGGGIASPFSAAQPDAVLGASARVAVLAAGPWLVVLEPNTEGRLAARLARHGEGLAAVYVSHPARPPIDGFGSGSRDGGQGRLLRPGPLGPSWLLAGGRAGPWVVEVGPRTAEPHFEARARH